jgi:DegV family protein with EDD domain
MTTSGIKIVTDSAADLSPELAQKYGISVVPLGIRFDDEEYLDGVELSNEAFWQKLAHSAELPSTAAPSPGSFEEVFKQAADEGYAGVVCVCLSSKLSGTFQSASQAARAVEDTISVRVIDSMACTMSQASLCVEAAETAASGGDTDAVVAAVENLHMRSHLFAALDTLDNLKKGGRIGAAGAFFGSILSIKPVITLRDGEVQAESRQRTRSRALDHLIQLVAERAPIDHVWVAHSSAPDLEKFLDLLTPHVAREAIQISHIGPVVGTHAGPGIIGISFASA